MLRCVLHKLPRLLFCAPVRPRWVSNYVVKLLRRYAGSKKIAVQYGWIVFLVPSAVSITQKFGKHLTTTLGHPREVTDIARFELIKKGKVETEARNSTRGALNINSAELLLQNSEQRFR